MKKIYLCISFTVQLVIAVVCYGQWSNVELLSGISWGWTLGYGNLQIAGNYIYVGSESGLHIIDISNPNSPVDIGQYNTPGGSTRVFLQGGIIYTANRFSGISIIDVSDPTNPFLIVNYEFDNFIPENIFVKYDYAYIIGGCYTPSYGLKVMDVSDPQNPYVVTSCDLMGGGRYLTINDNYLDLADWNYGLMIYDISNPAFPVLTGTYDFQGYDPKLEYIDDYIYISLDQAVYVFDVSNSVNPFPVDTIPEDVRCLCIENNTAYLGLMDGGFSIYNATNPAVPFLVNSFTSPVCFSIDADSSFLCTASGLSLGLYDLSNPVNPCSLSTFTEDGTATSLAINSTRAICAGQYEMQVVDISNPSEPFLKENFYIGHYDPHVYADNEYSIVSANLAGLYLFDVAYRDTVILLNHYACNSINAAIKDDYIYSCIPFQGVSVLDFSDPENIFEVEQFPCNAVDIVISGNYAYISEQNSVKILDISNPFSITQLFAYNYGFIRDIDLSGNYFYIAGYNENSYNSYLEIVDISYPSNPIHISTWSEYISQYSFWLIRLAVSSDHAFLAFGDYLKIIDVTNPANPREVGNYTDCFFEVKAFNNLAYAAGGYGLYIYDCSAALAVSSFPFSPQPLTFDLAPVSPNPFNSSTSVRFSLQTPGEVTLAVYDLLGRQTAFIAQEKYSPGVHSIDWNPKNLPSGIYFLRLQQGEKTSIQKVVYLK